MSRISIEMVMSRVIQIDLSSSGIKHTSILIFVNVGIVRKINGWNL